MLGDGCEILGGRLHSEVERVVVLDSARNIRESGRVPRGCRWVTADAGDSQRPEVQSGLVVQERRRSEHRSGDVDAVESIVRMLEVSLQFGHQFRGEAAVRAEVLGHLGSVPFLRGCETGVHLVVRGAPEVAGRAHLPRADDGAEMVLGVRARNSSWRWRKWWRRRIACKMSSARVVCVQRENACHLLRPS